MIDRAQVKCLHLHYAHHLARGNTVGRWMEEEGLIEGPLLRSRTD